MTHLETSGGKYSVLLSRYGVEGRADLGFRGCGRNYHRTTSLRSVFGEVRRLRQSALIYAGESNRPDPLTLGSDVESVFVAPRRIDLNCRVEVVPDSVPSAFVA